MTISTRIGLETPFAAPDPDCMTEVAEGIYWLRMPLPMSLDHVNIYVLDEGDGWTIIDTGFDTPKARALWSGFLAGPLMGRPVRRVVVTHHHPDHIGLAGWFQTHALHHDVALWCPRTAWLYARMLTLDVQERPAERQIEFWQRAGMDAALLARRRGERPFNFADVVHPLPLGYRRLCDGEMVQMGGRSWRVLMGNGHAPEHATFWCCDEELVIAGDQILPGISPNIGVYAAEPLADPLAEWLAACRRFVPLAQEGHFVLPGHKLPFYGLPVRLGQMIHNHETALARLLDVLAVPHNAADCFPVLFHRPVEAGNYNLALAEAMAHLNYLYHQNLVSRHLSPDGIWLWQRI